MSTLVLAATGEAAESSACEMIRDCISQLGYELDGFEQYNQTDQRQEFLAAPQQSKK